MLNFKITNIQNSTLLKISELRKILDNVSTLPVMITFDDSVLEIIKVIGGELKLVFSRGHYDSLQFAQLIYKGNIISTVNIFQNKDCKQLLNIYRKWSDEQNTKKESAYTIYHYNQQ